MIDYRFIYVIDTSTSLIQVLIHYGIVRHCIDVTIGEIAVQLPCLIIITITSSNPMCYLINGCNTSYLMVCIL
jgi:hypothetical protein